MQLHSLEYPYKQELKTTSAWEDDHSSSILPLQSMNKYWKFWQKEEAEKEVRKPWQKITEIAVWTSEVAEQI